MRFVTRDGWGAEPSSGPVDAFGDLPARYIIITQCSKKLQCTDTEECCKELRRVQHKHVENNGFSDIGYSYAIGNDDAVYETRGWQWRPATAKRWNSVSYGVVFLGAFDPDDAHCRCALFNARLLMAHLIENGKLRTDFTVYGLRQIRNYNSPHDKLFAEIQKWPEWKEYNISGNADGSSYGVVSDTYAVICDFVEPSGEACELEVNGILKQNQYGHILGVELQPFYAFLTERMDVDFGLLDELFAVGVLSERQVEDVKVERTRHERNEKLLQHLLKHKDDDELLTKFTSSLIKTGQIHLVNYVRNNVNSGNAVTNDELELPLTERELTILRCNHPALLSMLNPSSALLSSLVAAGCITEAHKEHVNNKSSKHDKNDELLNILRRRSLSSYQQFINCLRQHNQHTAALVLDGAGATVALHVKMKTRLPQPTGWLLSHRPVIIESRPEPNVRFRSRIPLPVQTKSAHQSLHDVTRDFDHFEERIASVLTIAANISDVRTILDHMRSEDTGPLKRRLLFAEALKRISTALQLEDLSDGDQSSLLLLLNELTANKMQILHARPECSVVIYILCETKESLTSLWKLMLSGRLKNLIYDVWNSFWSSSHNGKINVKLHMLFEDYTVAQACLHALKQFDRLPYEVLELILMRAVAARFIQEVKLTTHADAIALTAVNSVCWLWWKTINWKGFKKARRLVKNICRPYRCHQRLRITLQTEKGAAFGVAQLKNKIFVISLETDVINVFADQPSFARQTELVVKGINPRDIITFPPDVDPEHLFIADPYNNCVWQVTEDGHAEKFVPKEGTDVTFSPWTLSVRSSRLLVTAANHLYAFSPEGDQLSHVQLPASIDAEHAVETSSGTFVVCYNEMARKELHTTQTPTSIYRVSEVDINGQVLRFYGGPKGHLPGQMNQPLHLALDGEGRVFVADFENSRVLLLNCYLRLERVLLSIEDELDKPWRLLYVGSTGQLVVAMDNGQVNIYDVRI